jgi:hypothetical protein
MYFLFVNILKPHVDTTKTVNEIIKNLNLSNLIFVQDFKKRKEL